MPSNSSFQIDPRTQRDFAALINEMQRTTGADMAKVIRNTGRDFAVEAIKATPISPTSYASGKPIGTRGFAKAGWVLGLIDLGKTPVSQHHTRGGQKALTQAETVIKLEGKTPTVEIANQVPFIEEIPGAILEVALTATAIKMATSLNRMAAKMRERWR
jgi:hypothetical protein